MARQLHFVGALGKKRPRREAVPLIRLHILVEGQTEESFVNEILAPELGAHSIFADAHRITTGRRHGRAYRGGFLRYEHLLRDLILWMKQDQHTESWFTTMVDLHQLPSDFPGSAALPANLSAQERVARLESEFADDLKNHLEDLTVSQRFIPYIQLHEFEALLFSDPACFLEAFPGQQVLVNRLLKIRECFNCPEDINDGTAPSEHILAIVPEYQKPVAGLLIAQRIGIASIRSECRRFDQWITRLLDLSGS